MCGWADVIEAEDHSKGNQLALQAEYQAETGTSSWVILATAPHWIFSSHRGRRYG